MNSWINGFKRIVLLFLAGVIVGTSVSCEPLRKKFVRQKKKDQKEEFVPVLDPIEYPATIYSPENEYKKAYGLWKVWNKEYLLELGINENDKRQLYLVNEVISQLEEMKKVVRAEKQERFVHVISALNTLRQQYDLPAMMRRTYELRRIIEQNAKIVLNELNPTLMKESLINP